MGRTKKNTALNLINFTLHQDPSTNRHNPAGDLVVINTTTGKETQLGNPGYQPGGATEQYTRLTGNTGNSLGFEGANTVESTDVNTTIQDYYNKLDDYNQKQLEYTEKWNGIAQKNWENEFEFEQAKFDYQKDRNDLQDLREDTAVQRRMQDLAQAGINPLYAAQQGASTTLGTTAGNAPNSPSFGTLNIQAPQSQASAVVANLNSLRDYEISKKQLELDKEKIEEEQRKNRANENIEKSKVLQQVRNWNNQLTQAGIELQNANMQAQNEREFKEALENTRHANYLIELEAKYGWDQKLQEQAEKAKKDLQDSINKINAINTGNKIVDTIVNLAITILNFLKRY